MDREAKIPLALDALGPVAGRDVVLLGDTTGSIADRLTEAGANVTPISVEGLSAPDAAATADVLVVAFAAFRGPSPTELAAAQAILRPGGRLLVIHDYGRDDVSRLYGPRPEYGDWSRRDGPFLGNGFKIRVVHSWWTFDSIEEARDVLADGFGAAGERLAADLTRPRLSYNVAVYHRSFGAA
jgi:hypothetical protein